MATAPPEDDLVDIPLPKSKTKLIIIIVAVILFLCAIGGAGYYFLIKKPEAPEAQQTSKIKEPKAPIFIQLDSFTVNLLTASTDEPQFLQIGISLQLLQEKSTEQLKQRLPHVKNQILMLLTNSKASDIVTLEGKEQLIGKIVTQINELYKLGDENPVVGAFFTSFIIQ
jgi:flagellar FliL protein